MAANQTPEWLNKIYQELAPAHGRYEGALRTAIAATLATYVLLVLQTPLIAPGVYLIYLVSYDVPYLTFKTSVLELFYQCVGVALSLMLIAVTGTIPWPGSWAWRPSPFFPHSCSEPARCAWQP